MSHKTWGELVTKGRASRSATAAVLPCSRRLALTSTWPMTVTAVNKGRQGQVEKSRTPRDQRVQGGAGGGNRTRAVSLRTQLVEWREVCVAAYRRQQGFPHWTQRIGIVDILSSGAGAPRITSTRCSRRSDRASALQQRRRRSWKSRHQHRSPGLRSTIASDLMSPRSVPDARPSCR